MHTTDRLHALDAVRAFALILGIFFHAALSFVPDLAKASDQSDVIWLIGDNSPSIALSVVVGITHLFRMSLFFFIAGFFAHLVYHRKGAGAFLRDRSKRIALPFVVGWCVIIPMMGAAWHWAQAKTGTPPIPKMFFGPGTMQWSVNHLPLFHLWFLYYLLLIYVLVVGGRHLFADQLDPQGAFRKQIDAWLERALNKRYAPLLLSIPVGAAAAISSVALKTGIPTPDHSLVPEIIPLANFGVAFFGGWLFHRNTALLNVLSMQLKSSLWMGLLAWLVAGCALAVAILNPGMTPIVFKFLVGYLLAVTAWYWSFGIVGYALKKFMQPSARIRYAADSSYWLYLMHLPLVCALQVWVAYWPIHWSIKYPLIVTIAFAVLLTTYHYLVRFTFIGAVLNGRKHARVVQRPVNDLAVQKVTTD